MLGGAHKQGFYKECNLMVDILPLKMPLERVLNLDRLASSSSFIAMSVMEWDYQRPV